MKSIIISPKSKEEMDLLSKLLKKLNVDAAYLSEDEKEDLGLKLLMREADRKKTVSRASVMKKLGI